MTDHLHAGLETVSARHIGPSGVPARHSAMRCAAARSSTDAQEPAAGLAPAPGPTLVGQITDEGAKNASATHHKTEGEVIIDTNDATIHCMVVGSVVVTARRRLVINGSVIGTVTVQPGAHVDLHGVLIGSITSHGGKVNVTGVLEGAMSGESFEVCAGAVVHDVTQAIDRGIH